MQWQFLAGAIVVEVIGTISLRVAATGQRAYYTPPQSLDTLLLSGSSRSPSTKGLAWGPLTGSGRPPESPSLQ